MMVQQTPERQTYDVIVRRVGRTCTPLTVATFTFLDRAPHSNSNCSRTAYDTFTVVQLKAIIYSYARIATRFSHNLFTQTLNVPQIAPNKYLHFFIFF